MTPQHPAIAKLIAEVVSAVLGMLGSWLLARRYAREPIRALFFAVIWPFLIPFGGKKALA